MPVIFVTATGTDIGKTYVSLGLIAHWRGEGRKVAALKPVASGFDPAAAANSDSALLLRGLGRNVDETSLGEISPWRFAAPLSPDMAARRENRRIDFAGLVDFCRASMAASDDILLIEGIGGLMVPLDSRRTVLDLIVEIAVPILLVAGTYLGTLSHVLTACAAARQRDVEIRALVLNQSPDCVIPIEETEATLTQFYAPVPIISLARGETAENRARFARLATLCEAPASLLSGSVI